MVIDPDLNFVLDYSRLFRKSSQLTLFFQFENCLKAKFEKHINERWEIPLFVL